MDFIVDNYFWFIVGGIVILMIIIGYIAEKTDFGRKPFKTNKDDNKEKTIVNEESVEEASSVESSNEIAEINEEIEIPVESDIENSVADFVEENDDLNLAEEENLETIVAEPMSDLNISEVTGTEDNANELSDVVEEVAAADDLEDDVWKF